MSSRKHRGTRPRSKLPQSPKKEPTTIGTWWRSAPNARVTRNELMRWAEGMTVMTRPDVIDMLREYERLRSWRRTKAFFNVSRSPIWNLIKRSMFEPKKSLADLSEESRDRVRAELDAVERAASVPKPPEEGDAA